jgi:hypothetical protein
MPPAKRPPPKWPPLASATGTAAARPIITLKPAASAACDLFMSNLLYRGKSTIVPSLALAAVAAMKIR